MVFAGFLFQYAPRAEDLSLSEFDQKINEKEKGLRQVKQKLSWQKKKARKMEKEENYILFRLSRLDKAIDKYRTEIKKIKRRLKIKEKEKKELSRRLNELEKDFTSRKAAIIKRLTGIYKAQALGFDNIIWNSRDLSEFWRRYKLIKQIAAADGELFARLKADYQEIVKQKAATEKKRWEIVEQNEEKKKKLRQLVANQTKKKDLLHSVRRRKKNYLRAVSELEEAAGQMKNLIAELGKKKSRALSTRFGNSSLYQGKGSLPWPTDGVVSREFGRQKHPEFGTFYDYQGMDINAPTGRPVKVVADGEILYADWFRGYGKIIIVDHKAGFYTLYGHLSGIKVSVGDKVSGGQVIGAVGDTGSIRGSYLYFEVRQGARQLNPRLWLSKK